MGRREMKDSYNKINTINQELLTVSYGSVTLNLKPKKIVVG